MSSNKTNMQFYPQFVQKYFFTKKKQEDMHVTHVKLNPNEEVDEEKLCDVVSINLTMCS